MRFHFNRQGYVAKVTSAAKAAVKEGAQIFEDAIKEKLSGPSPSSPGSPPGMDTGNLYHSVHINDISQDDANPMYEVTSDAIYADIQEYGGTIRAVNGQYLHFKTRDGNWVKVEQVTLPPRPAWRPAYDETVDEIKHHIAQKLAEA